MSTEGLTGQTRWCCLLACRSCCLTSVNLEERTPQNELPWLTPWFNMSNGRCTHAALEVLAGFLVCGLIMLMKASHGRGAHWSKSLHTDERTAGGCCLPFGGSGGLSFDAASQMLHPESVLHVALCRWTNSPGKMRTELLSNVTTCCLHTSPRGSNAGERVPEYIRNILLPQHEGVRIR